MKEKEACVCVRVCWCVCVDERESEREGKEETHWYPRFPRNISRRRANNCIKRDSLFGAVDELVLVTPLEALLNASIFP